jgi:hypothetical protein
MAQVVPINRGSKERDRRQAMGRKCIQKLLDMYTHITMAKKEIYLINSQPSMEILFFESPPPPELLIAFHAAGVFLTHLPEDEKSLSNKSWCSILIHLCTISYFRLSYIFDIFDHICLVSFPVYVMCQVIAGSTAISAMFLKSQDDHLVVFCIMDISF